jgi:putative ABC transport system ATP-binding protein
MNKIIPNISSNNSDKKSLSSKSTIQANNQDIFKLESKTLGDPVLTCTNINKIYKLPGGNEDVLALKHISLSDDCEFKSVKQGEFVIIRGPSGGGKTTLLNIIGTLDSDFEGELEIMRTKINKSCNDEFLSKMRLKNIGFVFQTFNLISTMTAAENVELPMTIENILPDAEKRKRGIALLARVGLEDRADHLPSELSGGEQQRVAIARALSNKPDLLLLDEPTGDLDSTSTIEVMNLLLSINKFGPDSEGNRTTIIMVTHNPELECYADRILYVQDGVFLKQILNEYQIALTVEEYISYINSNL